MSPPTDNHRKQLIRRGSVKLVDPGHPERWGTGFFVACDLILTCWHVVRHGPLESNSALETIKVLQAEPVGGTPVAIGTADFLERAEQWDLALLRFWSGRDLTPAENPVVLPLQEAEPSDQAPLFVGSFPFDTNGWHEANYLYPGLTTLGDPPLPYLRLKHDGVVGGFSGAALIDKARWWVCGVVSRNDLPGGAIDGGLAVPLTRVQLDTAFPLHGEELLRRNRSEAHPHLLEPPPSGGSPTTRRILSTIDPPPAVSVVGREPELEELAALMGSPGNNSHVVVHGVSGVGKSELLREYARRHAYRYPGGRYWINCSLGPTEELLRIGRQCWGLDGLEGTAAEQAGQVLRLLAAEAVLLIYDNATAEDVLAEWLPPAGKAHVLVSSVSRDWGPLLFQEWNRDGLKPLSRQSGEELVKAIVGPEVAHQFGEQLLSTAGGLPMQIIPSAQALRRLERNGRLNRAKFPISQEAENSFALPWGLLDGTAQLLLQAAAGLNTDAMAESEVLLPLTEALGGQQCVEVALDVCRDLYLIEGIGSLRMHQLLASFVAAQPAEPSADGTSLDQLRRLQAGAMVEAAKAVNANPADPEAIARFLSYPLVWERWAVWADSISADGYHQIGTALYQLGRFSVALPWYQQAQAETCKGDLHGRVDHQNLGGNLHQIGNCFFEQGEWMKAAEWYEKAQAETRRGDLHGRVDHENLGTTLHQIGNCFFEQGELPKAAEWYEKAQEETRRGDLQGRVDHQSLSRTLHMIGNCFLMQQEWPKAVGWYEKAQEETRKGDLHGRVDHQSLGRTLMQIGTCFFGQREYLKAAEWFEKAQAETCKGDLYGRVDHWSLGTILLFNGMYLHQQGEWMKAAECFEQAQEETRKGDLHGRVDHQLVGMALHRIGNCFFEQGEWLKAAECYEKAHLEARQGDIYRRIDKQFIAINLSALVKVLKVLGRGVEAMQWQAMVDQFESE
jgi:tetratricopeptide (TPR) repeat protein